VRARGFSLVELSIVVLVIGIVLTMGIGAWTANLENQAHAATAQRQAAIKEALTGYLRRNNRLPCPDSDFTAPDGVENRTTAGDPTTACSAAFGIIPYTTLSLARDAARDGWGNFFSYHVSNTNITASVAGNWSANTDWTRSAWFRTGSTGLITVNNRNGATVTAIATNVVAVVVSHGRNGFGAYTISGTRNTLATTGTDEENNTNAGTTYLRRDLTTDDAATGGPFDDQVLILTANDLLEPLFRDGSLRAPVAIVSDSLQRFRVALIGQAMGYSSTYGGTNCTSAPDTIKCRVIMSADNMDGYGSNDIGNNDGLVPYKDIGLSLSEALDPWGRRYRYKPNSLVIQPSMHSYGVGSNSPTGNTIAMQIYSEGPNRTDEGGLGDDISISVSVSEVRGYLGHLLP
jgi:prepilin-type N-terminal cleavage/methylation domain-containing protein